VGRGGRVVGKRGVLGGGGGWGGWWRWGGAWGVLFGVGLGGFVLGWGMGGLSWWWVVVDVEGVVEGVVGWGGLGWGDRVWLRLVGAEVVGCAWRRWVWVEGGVVCLEVGVGGGWVGGWCGLGFRRVVCGGCWLSFGGLFVRVGLGGVCVWWRGWRVGVYFGVVGWVRGIVGCDVRCVCAGGGGCRRVFLDGLQRLG